MTNEYNPDGKEIRFIDSHYKDLFHIPDGSCVQIHYPDEMVVKPCTFIDEYHTQIGYNVFHICQFAEIMERNGASYMPEPEIMGDEAAWNPEAKDRLAAASHFIHQTEDQLAFTPSVTGIDNGIHVGAIHQSTEIFKSVLFAGCQHIAERLRQNGEIIIAPFLEILVIAARIHRGYQVPHTPGNEKSAALIKAIGPG